MTLYATLGITAGVLSLGDTAIYVLAIYGFNYRLRRIPNRTRPNRITWFIWATLGIITAASYWASGATDTLWFAIAYAMGYLIVATLSIRHGEGGFELTDVICITGAILSVFFWWLFNSPQVALFATIAIDAFGTIPTIKKASLKPRGENRVAWTMSAIASLFNVLAINWMQSSFAVFAYPIYMLVANGSITSILWRKQGKM